MIISRPAWGAQPAARPPAPHRRPYAHLDLHHSVTSRGGAALVRRIQADHQRRGWRDGAYNWFVADDGIYEGIQGEHLNSGAGTSETICLVGNYDTHPVPASMIERAGWLVAHGLLAGWWTGGITRGHRQVPGASSVCPGRHGMAAIPLINAAAARIVHSLAPGGVDVIRPGDSGPQVQDLADVLRFWIDPGIPAGQITFDARLATASRTLKREHLQRLAPPGWMGDTPDWSWRTWQVYGQWLSIVRGLGAAA